jgi:hypothetical protein
MRTVTAISLLVLAAIFTAPAATTNVTAVIKGKSVALSMPARAQIAQKSLDLLASSAYVDPKPKWGAGSTEPRSMADVQRESHLHLLFSMPVKVQIPIEKVTVQVHEMVISLPLATAGIWVRTDDQVMYFAMFDYKAYDGLHQALDDAQKP